MAGDLAVRFVIQREGELWKLYSETITARSGALLREAVVGKTFFSADEAEVYARNILGAKTKEIRRAPIGLNK